MVHNFKNSNVTLYTLSDYANLIEKATEAEYVLEKDIQTLQEWRKNPADWNTSCN